jgi:putative ABC transport system permease protein
MRLLAADVQLAVRTLFKRPWFTVVATLTIALGIGASASIFSVVDAVLLTPLPLEEPNELVYPNIMGPSGFPISLSIPNFRDWREQNQTFVSFGANVSRSRTLTGGERPEIVQVRLVLGDFFETLGVPPARGRFIESDSTWAGAEPVAVVTHGFWQRHFGGDADVLGRTLTLDSEPFTIIGVMPEGFAFPSTRAEVFLPMGYFSERMCWDSRGCSQGTWAIARLRPGATLAAAQAEMDRITNAIEAQEGTPQAHAELQMLQSVFVEDIEVQIWVLMAAVSFLLLVACANVGSLLVARGEARSRELAIRSALGAGRSRLLKQLLTESLVLATAGGLLGIALARGFIHILLTVLQNELPSDSVNAVSLDFRVVAFALLATALAGLLFGIAPAVRGSRADLREALSEGNRGSSGRSRQRLRAGLVASEVALAVVLLVGSGLMISSLHNLNAVDKGFRAEGVFTAEVSLPRARYADKAAAWQFFERLLERVETLPGVSSASVANFVPLNGNSWERGIYPEGIEIIPENGQSVLFHMVSPGHLEALGIPLLQGRGFDRRDNEGSERVALVDETMAAKFWPGQSPLGQRVTFEQETEEEDSLRVWRTVVGVTRNVRHYEIENASRIQVYVPIQQSHLSWSTSMSLLLRSERDPLALTEPVRRAVESLDPDVPLAGIQTMDGLVRDAMGRTRTVGVLLSVFSGLALAFAAIGLFGVTSYFVAQRLREFGIRIALGAVSRDIVSGVARETLLVTSVGLTTGLLVAFGLSQLMSHLFFGVAALELSVYGAVVLSLLAVSVIAALTPALRATRVDPATILRED